jgi:hypothetical protein
MIPFELPFSLPGNALFIKSSIDIVLHSRIFHANHLKSFIHGANKPSGKIIYFLLYTSLFIRTTLDSLLMPPSQKEPDNPFLLNTLNCRKFYLLEKSHLAFPVHFRTRFSFLIPYVQYGVCPGKWPAVTNDSFI